MWLLASIICLGLLGSRAAAEIYLALSKDKSPVNEILAMINDPDNQFTTLPVDTMKWAEWMHKVGAVKVKPGGWKDMFFPNVHNLAGS